MRRWFTAAPLRPAPIEADTVAEEEAVGALASWNWPMEMEKSTYHNILESGSLLPNIETEEMMPEFGNALAQPLNFPQFPMPLSRGHRFWHQRYKQHLKELQVHQTWVGDLQSPAVVSSQNWNAVTNYFHTMPTNQIRIRCRRNIRNSNDNRPNTKDHSIDHPSALVGNQRPFFCQLQLDKCPILFQESWQIWVTSSSSSRRTCTLLSSHSSSARESLGYSKVCIHFRLSRNPTRQTISTMTLDSRPIVVHPNCCSPCAVINPRKRFDRWCPAIPTAIVAPNSLIPATCGWDWANDHRPLSKQLASTITSNCAAWNTLQFQPHLFNFTLCVHMYVCICVFI